MKKTTKYLYVILVALLFIFISDDKSMAYAKDDFDISDDSMSLYVGKSYTLEVSDYLDNEEYTVQWSSKNKDIATVSQSGKVTGKKKGTTTITATIGNVDLKCKVTVKKVPPTYKQVVTQAKKYKKKGYVVYDTIDLGNHARLYAAPGSGVSEPTDKKLYVTYGIFQPYIDIVKKGNTAKIKLQMNGKYGISSYEEYDLDLNKLTIYTDNRRTSFELDSADETYKIDYNTYIRTDESKWRTTLSTNTEINKENLDKVIKMFRQKKVIVKISGSSGVYGKIELEGSARKVWLKFFEDYKALLKLYE